MGVTRLAGSSPPARAIPSCYVLRVRYGPAPVGDPRTVLREVFGYEAFRPLQREVIECVVGGGDAFVLMPTGGGKSLCYQVPALVRPGTAVIVSPLISLMKDQVDALVANGVAAAFYNRELDLLLQISHIREKKPQLVKAVGGTRNAVYR